MTFIDYVRRLADPSRADNAPASAVNRTQQRNNRRNARMPRPGENFADYTNRVGTGDTTIARRGNTGEALTQQQRDSQTATGARAITRAQDGPTPGQELTQIAVESYNAQSMTLSDIPMGVEGAFPRMNSEALPTRGGHYASGAEYDRSGWPTNLVTQPIDWGSPDRRAGIISWGVDLRRPEADVLGDVERVAGVQTPGFLNWISMRESDLSRGRRQYDQGGPDSTSAQGPHQFTEWTFKTWLTGLGSEYGIPTANLSRSELQDLRYDIRVSGAMTAESARFYAGQITANEANAPTPNAAELYLAHHGGPEGVDFVRALRKGDENGRAIDHYSTAAVNNHLNDYYINGDRTRPRSNREFFDWMTGQNPRSPHRRNYRGQGMEGVPLEPVVFGARANGTTDTPVNPQAGVVRFERTP